MVVERAGWIRLEFLRGALVPAIALLVITIAKFGLARGLAAALLFVLSVLAHECGHLLAAWLTGTRFSAIGFCLFGAYNRRERAHGGDEFFISAAGPTVNLAIAALLTHTTGMPAWLAQMNLLLFFLNLLPFGHSDGQRMLALVREGMRRRRRPERALSGNC